MSIVNAFNISFDWIFQNVDFISAFFSYASELFQNTFKCVVYCELIFSHAFVDFSFKSANWVFCEMHKLILPLELLDYP
jgi:hypothetical protein